MGKFQDQVKAMHAMTEALNAQKVEPAPVYIASPSIFNAVEVEPVADEETEEKKNKKSK